LKIKNIFVLKLLFLTAVIFFVNSPEAASVNIPLTNAVKNLKDWIIESGDNQHLPFIIVDKKAVTVYVFEQDGKIVASTISLIGRTVGDDNATGIGQKRLADIEIHERTTPAGRFEASLDFNEEKKEILWIDYDLDLSLHSVITTNPTEHRLQRLRSNHLADHRITYGCINVPAQFYKDYIHMTFEQTHGIVYILPEVHSILQVFGSDAANYNNRK
jgi:hypothetical protein